MNRYRVERYGKPDVVMEADYFYANDFALLIVKKDVTVAAFPTNEWQSVLLIDEDEFDHQPTPEKKSSDNLDIQSVSNGTLSIRSVT